MVDRVRRVLRAGVLLAAAVGSARADDGDRAAADAAFAAGRWTDAVALYERAVASNAADAVAWIRLGLARLESGDVPAARTAVARAGEVEGRTARVEFATGRIALVAAEFEAAVRAFTETRRKDPAYERAWSAQNLGYALHRLGRLEDARRAYAEALARPAGELSARMYVNAAKNELALDDVPAACGILVRGRAAFPRDAWLADVHGWALTLAGDRRAASAAYAAARDAAARPAGGAPVVVPLPMSGVLRVLQGRIGAYSHESLRNAEAVDLVALDRSGREWTGDGKRNEDHVVFGRPVLAVGDGEVIAAEDGHADQRPGDVATGTPRGNYVYVRHGARLVSRYFHLRSGSVAVRPGARVRRGDTLAACGNSGYSTRPHLCFGVAAAPPEEDVTVAFRFGPCLVRTAGEDRPSEAADPAQGAVLTAR